MDTILIVDVVLRNAQEKNKKQKRRGIRRTRFMQYTHMPAVAFPRTRIASGVKTSGVDHVVLMRDSAIQYVYLRDAVIIVNNDRLDEGNSLFEARCLEYRNYFVESPPVPREEQASCATESSDSSP